ncbi:hypothetical protein PGT21_021415 [Puccinia graminis f. sp. tritici]|uniref:Uncharacterized protein n=1 Tax=Puccinia graminis f. sp. tritici TaxID=56615 RepID=A0A5B0P7K6_PUCGR|nr:hypothetical protein PGT21_021415 [Puccinia graminis f. sp. tritici]KAA1131858.1 hypothetical protein PGTUg99_030629 [Puccinia graminis f. sp. tritici]
MDHCLPLYLLPHPSSIIVRDFSTFLVYRPNAPGTVVRHAHQKLNSSATYHIPFRRFRNLRGYTNKTCSTKLNLKLTIKHKSNMI